MTFLLFFDNIWFYNISLFFVVFYLLASIVFAAHFACCDKFDRPVLLKSFNSFTAFFISLLFWLFCFDFVSNDKLYFFSQNIELLFIFFILSVVFCSYDFLVAKHIIKYEYDLLFIFVVFSGICLCFANEFLLIYLAIELQSLTLYIFATFNRNSEFSTEAGLKYFVFGGVMSCFLLFGLCLIYLYFGSVSFEMISSINVFGCDQLFFSGFMFVLVVFIFKVGAAPFHFWLSDVYEGSILPVTLLFSSAPKIILFGLLLKLCFFVLFDYSNLWSIFLGCSAVISIIVGSICAIYQKRLKRLFAYSTIAHTGFILLAFLCSSLDSAKSLVFYIVIYSTLTVTTFAILINIASAVLVQPKYLINLSGIGYRNYIFASTFGLIILAIAGIPPLAGFFSKFFILLSVIGSEYYFISLTVIFFSSIACFYYIRLVKIMFFLKDSKNSIWIANKSNKNTEVIIGVFMFFILCYFLRPNLIIDFAIALGLVMF
jgi:NADH-quinone oxidoreductase subunit N